MNILVVDDDPVVRSSCRRILEADGHRVRLCAGTTQALEELQREDCQLLVADVIMPDFDGLYLIGQVRRDHPGLPILVMSGYPTPETIASGRKLGANHFIAKPFTPGEFSAAVARALSGREEV